MKDWPVLKENDIKTRCCPNGT